MKASKLTTVKVEDEGSRRDLRNVPRMLRRLAAYIERGDYGKVLNVQMVMKASESKHAKVHVFGFGPDETIDPIKVFYQGMKEVARVAEPPMQVSEPNVTPVVTDIEFVG